jgi:hypothetical protein
LKLNVLLGHQRSGSQRLKNGRRQNSWNILSISCSSRVKAEVPGLSKEDLDVSLTESTLTIKGGRKPRRKRPKKKITTAASDQVEAPPEPLSFLLKSRQIKRKRLLRMASRRFDCQRPRKPRRK